MIKTQARLRSKNGFHARPASEFMKKAQGFQADIQLTSQSGKQVNGKSITGILTLGLERNSTFEIAATGTDATEAVEVLKFFVENEICD